MTAQVQGEQLKVFTYRPRRVALAGLLFLFDGVHRDASGMRDKATALAERAGIITFAPHLDRERFPKWRYNSAGVIRRGQKQPRELWTGPLLQRLFEWARDVTGQPSARLFLFGHSAGGQMLSRICAYSPLSSTARIVIANPSAYVAPLLDEPTPYGFAGIFAPAEAVARLQVYLALPITIYLGQRDTGSRNLATSNAAMRQGRNRLQRGRRTYQSALTLAHRNAWAFNWQLVEAPRVGHSSRAMLHAAPCYLALGLQPEASIIQTNPLSHAPHHPSTCASCPLKQ